ncbi:hypothetical protein ACLOJK_027812 [Asimina triloba]
MRIRRDLHMRMKEKGNWAKGIMEEEETLTKDLRNNGDFRGTVGNTTRARASLFMPFRRLSCLLHEVYSGRNTDPGYSTALIWTTVFDVDGSSITLEPSFRGQLTTVPVQTLSAPSM